MNKIRIGVICPSEIAFRRFLPSLRKVADFEFGGVAIASASEWGISEESYAPVYQRELAKAQSFTEVFGGKIFEGYATLCASPDIDAVYLPLPPALHYRWAKLALEHGKHALVEKPFTTSLADTQDLLTLAEEKGLAVHEDYMFIYHNQLQAIRDIIDSGEIGKVRHYRIQFGFPRRPANDFRYQKALGGGALLDAGGYTIKYASLLLGDSAMLTAAASTYEDEWDVDIFGSATMANQEGCIAQLAFGMDNNYKCLLEAWGSLGTLTTGRVLTAPDGFSPDVIIRKGNEEEMRQLPSDEAFVKSIRHFAECIRTKAIRLSNDAAIRRQAQFIEQFIAKANS